MLTQTKPRKRFKELLGQANHFITTSLVGLHGIEKGVITAAPPELHAAWSPRNPTASAQRARHYILRNALSSAVDAVDMYLSLLWRDPKWITGAEVEKVYSNAGQRVFFKVTNLGSLLKVPEVELALTQVLITWRNNVVHELADNSLSELCVRVLSDKAEAIKENYCGLDISNLAQKAQSGADPTFKETASLIRAAHQYVEHFDARVMQRLDPVQFIVRYVEHRFQRPGFKTEYFSAAPTRREALVANVIENELGLSRADPWAAAGFQAACVLKNERVSSGD